MRLIFCASPGSRNDSRYTRMAMSKLRPAQAGHR